MIRLMPVLLMLALTPLPNGLDVGQQHEPCKPALASDTLNLPKLDLESLVGSYTLTVITQWQLRKDSMVTGQMDLWLDSTPVPIVPPPIPDRDRLNARPYPRPSLVGATTAPVQLIYVWTSIDPESRVPGAPGIRLDGNALLFGACPEGVLCADGFQTSLVVTHANERGLRGRWRLWPDMMNPVGVEVAGWPSGYFCAVRN